MGADKSSKAILALLDERGFKTFSALDRENNLRTNTASNAARYPVAKGEYAIAKALRMEPKEIWPSRYDATTGNRLSPQPRRNYPNLPDHAA